MRRQTDRQREEQTKGQTEADEAGMGWDLQHKTERATVTHT